MLHKQRFRCRQCHKRFIWKRPDVKTRNGFSWFQLWIHESDSVRRLSGLSGHSTFKIKQIKNYWLSQTPEKTSDFSKIKYALYDGTYFGRNNCFMVLMNAQDQSIADHVHTSKEGYHYVLPWLYQLRAKGLNPLYVAMDGEISVMRAIREVWPRINIQRCLYHIQREGLRWLRTFPKTQAGCELRAILSTLASIKSFKDRDIFIQLFHAWINAHYAFIRTLPSSSIQFRDLKKTVTLIKNAMPDMFHYLDDPNIPSTTNALEGFYSRLKSDYQRHRGLSKEHRISYLNWYCHLKNCAASTIF